MLAHLYTVKFADDRKEEKVATYIYNISLSVCIFLQSGSHQSAYLSQHPGAAVSGWQHLHHLLCGGAFSETWARKAGAYAVGEKWGKWAQWTSLSLSSVDWISSAGPRNQWKLRIKLDTWDWSGGWWLLKDIFTSSVTKNVPCGLIKVIV